MGISRTDASLGDTRHARCFRGNRLCSVGPRSAAIAGAFGRMVERTVGARPAMSPGIPPLGLQGPGLQPAIRTGLRGAYGIAGT